MTSKRKKHLKNSNEKVIALLSTLLILFCCRFLAKKAFKKQTFGKYQSAGRRQNH